MKQRTTFMPEAVARAQVEWSFREFYRKRFGEWPGSAGEHHQDIFIRLCEAFADFAERTAPAVPDGTAELRAWLAGQALAGMGTWIPYPWDAEMDDPRCDLKTPEAQAERAGWAVAQADAMLIALGLRAPTHGEWNGPAGQEGEPS